MCQGNIFLSEQIFWKATRETTLLLKLLLLKSSLKDSSFFCLEIFVLKVIILLFPNSFSETYLHAN